MITDLFQTTPPPADQLIGIYNYNLVALSFIVAVFASYVALDISGRIRDLSNTRATNFWWFAGGSIAMGCGIWSMHFIGMLSFTIPGLSIRYDLFWTLISLLVAIIASGFALFLLKSSVIRLKHYIAGGVILGFGIASMHYTGMEGMFISLNIRYLPNLFFISILVAILASEAAIWLALKSNQAILRQRNLIKNTSAVIMGLAICCMHYTGMQASIFTSLCVPTSTASTSGLDPTYLSIWVATITFVILTIAIITSRYRAINQQKLDKARQLGMAEISATVLHNVGNVLNSINVSASTIDEKINSSKLSGLEKLATMLNANKHNLSEFFGDIRGHKAVDFVNALAQYWREEESLLKNEITRLNRNLILIKEIISTQQELSKLSDHEQSISINEMLDEAVLISGMHLQSDIKVIKQYDKLEKIFSDKVKMLQAFVNLVQNAKDALIESSNVEKVFTITTTNINADKIKIELTDTGIGISAKNLNRIFGYGFTTKQHGHGFGLHTSALSISGLGGEIRVESKGLNKGTKFTILLPKRKEKD